MAKKKLTKQQMAFLAMLKKKKKHGTTTDTDVADAVKTPHKGR